MPFRHPSRRRVARLAAGFALGLPPSLAQAQPVPEATVAWHCYRNSAATVLATEKTESVGSKLLVRRPTADLKADCAVEQRPSDRVLGVDDSPDEGSFFYIALAKSFLILDNGTGPDRGLVIYEVPQAASGSMSATRSPAPVTRPPAARATISGSTTRVSLSGGRSTRSPRLRIAAAMPAS